jgi:hypothetical protein
MTIVRTVLYVFSALFVLGGLLFVLPWGWLNAFMGWFGPYTYPDDPHIQYAVKITMATFAWVGVLMAVTVFQGAKYQAIMLLFGLMYLSLAVCALVLVWIYALPWPFYGDVVSSAVLGALFLVYRSQTLSREAPSG